MARAPRPSEIRKRRERFYRALESGKYKQGRGQLRQGEAFCCLGVACDIAKRAVKGVWVDYRKFSVDGSLNALSMPPAVVNYYKFGMCDPALREWPASFRNDTHRLTFKEIAKLFREQFPGVNHGS